MADDKNAQERLAEQQAAFNKEALKTEELLGNLSSLLRDGVEASIKKSSKNIRDLNTSLGQGVDITKKLNTEILNSGKRIEELEFQRNLNLATLTKEEAIRANRKLDAELKIENQLNSQLQKLQQHLETEEKITEENKKQNSLGQSLKKAFEDNFNITIRQVKEMFTLTGMINMMVKGLKTANENSVWISKNLGYGAVNADIMTDKMQLMSLASNDTNITLKSAHEAMVQLAGATGGVAEFSADALKTQIMLTKQLGLSAEEAAGIYKFSVLTGKSSETVNDEMLAAFANTRNAVKGSANFKETMAAAAKVSGQLAANFRNNAAAITSAVVQAQALGTTLEKTKNQGAALLNFESSIEDELKAELLTGQQMNLERARAAALQGDQVTVMKELANQGMTIEKYQSMNVLAQESFAKALGLSADELADQLNKQKIAQEQGKSLAELNAEELKAAEKRKTIQDKFNNMMEKLQDIVGSIGTLFMPIIESITWLLDHSIVVYGILGLWLLRSKGIAANFKGILDSVKNIGTSIGNKIMGKGAAPTTPAAPTGGQPGGGLMSNMPSATNMLKGAAAMLVLSAAVFVAAKAFQEFAKVTWESVIKGGVALLGLAGIAMLLGKAVGPITEGAIAIGILGISLIPLAFALRIATPAIEAFGNVITKVFNGLATVITASAGGISTIFGSLQNVDVSKLLAIGPALTMIGIGLASLGAGNVIAAIGSFLGGDPIKKIERLAASGNGLQAAATGLQGIASGLTQVAAALAAIDASKLDALSNFAVKMSIGSVVKGITDFITAPIKAVEGAIGGGGASDNTEMIKAINEVRDAVHKLYNKNTTINMDGKKVGTTLSQNSHKVA
jgi:hypothetical protein